MEKLNKLFALAQRADACGNVIDCVNPHDVIDIAESFLDMKKRAEAAERKLAALVVAEDLLVRLEEQVNTISDWYHIDEHSCKVNRRDLMTITEACRAASMCKIKGDKSD